MAMTIVTLGTSYWTARRLRRYPVQPDAGSRDAPHTTVVAETRSWQRQRN